MKQALFHSDCQRVADWKATERGAREIANRSGRFASLAFSCLFWPTYDPLLIWDRHWVKKDWHSLSYVESREKWTRQYNQSDSPRRFEIYNLISCRKEEDARRYIWLVSESSFENSMDTVANPSTDILDGWLCSRSLIAIRISFNTRNYNRQISRDCAEVPTYFSFHKIALILYYRDCNAEIQVTKEGCSKWPKCFTFRRSVVTKGIESVDQSTCARLDRKWLASVASNLHPLFSFETRYANCWNI